MRCGSYYPSGSFWMPEASATSPSTRFWHEPWSINSLEGEVFLPLLILLTSLWSYSHITQPTRPASGDAVFGQVSDAFGGSLLGVRSQNASSFVGRVGRFSHTKLAPRRCMGVAHRTIPEATGSLMRHLDGANIIRQMDIAMLRRNLKCAANGETALEWNGCCDRLNGQAGRIKCRISRRPISSD